MVYYLKAENAALGRVDSTYVSLQKRISYGDREKKVGARELIELSGSRRTENVRS